MSGSALPAQAIFVNGVEASLPHPTPVAQESSTEERSSIYRPAHLWRFAVRHALGKNALALLDQALVSGTNFLTTVLVGRWCGAEELGVYSLGFSLVVWWSCAQEALISLPYIVLRHRQSSAEPGEYAGSVLVHQGILSALALLVLAVIAATLSFSGAAPGLATVSWVLAGLMPFVLLREFCRRYCFAHLRMAEALLLDAAVAAVQLAGIVWLASVGFLSAATAYAVIGTAGALIGTFWLYRARGSFGICWGKIGATLLQSWSLGKWLFGWHATLAVQAYFIYWLLAWLLGTRATGVYAACMTIPLFSNPLILGIANALAPGAADALHKGGLGGLRRVVFQTTVLLAVAMVLFCGVVTLWGGALMELLYRGEQYQGYGQLVAVLALAMLAAALGMPATNALIAVERADVVFKVALAALAVSVVLTPPLVLIWGITGAAYGFLAGNAFGAVGRWLALKGSGTFATGLLTSPSLLIRTAEKVPTPDQTESVIRVLGQFTRSSGDRAWVIEAMNEGSQATIFAVRRQDKRPIWETHVELAVKLYKPASCGQTAPALCSPSAEIVRAPDWEGGNGVCSPGTSDQNGDRPPADGAAVRGQFEALAELHGRLNGQVINGWKLHVPAPVYLCEQPRAMVMTMVPGTPLTSCLETSGGVPVEAIEPIAQGIATAMERYWSGDSPSSSELSGKNGKIHVPPPHGDLNFDNVLCDAAAGSLSFVDAGVLSNVFLCDGIPKGRYPASRDLAYLLYDTFVSVRSTIGKPEARRRRLCLVEKILRAYMKGIALAEERRRLLDEIEACFQVYLQTLRVSWSPRGLWRRVLRRIGARHISDILGKLRAAEIAADAAALNQAGTEAVLPGVFDTLDRAGIAYCVTHGYEDYPQRIKSDVDCVISPDMTPRKLALLFHENRGRIGATLIRSRGYYFVLAGRNRDGSPCFVHFDFGVNSKLDGRHFYDDSDLLQSRRRYRQFWVPAVSLEFGCYLIRRICKGGLDEEQGRRLSRLYQENPAGCEREVSRFWKADSAALIISAAQSGNWQPVRNCLENLSSDLRRAARPRPWRASADRLRHFGGRLKRALRPDGGLDVIVLGPDGAGKSSVVGAMRETLAGAFNGTVCYRFPPGLLGRLLGRPAVPDTRPHASRPRSFLSSAFRAVFYWFLYGTLGYCATVRLDLARSRLVLHDRHFVDALVDPRRYRYGGPLWLLRLIWRFLPKPDLVILLDAPPEVLQGRKQEVPLAETARQREAYLALAGKMTNAHVLNAARPLEQVVADVDEIILRQMAARSVRRLGLEQNA